MHRLIQCQHTVTYQTHVFVFAKKANKQASKQQPNNSINKTLPKQNWSKQSAHHVQSWVLNPFLLGWKSNNKFNVKGAAMCWGLLSALMTSPHRCRGDPFLRVPASSVLQSQPTEMGGKRRESSPVTSQPLSIFWPRMQSIAGHHDHQKRQKSLSNNNDSQPCRAHPWVETRRTALNFNKAPHESRLSFHKLFAAAQASWTQRNDLHVAIDIWISHDCNMMRKFKDATSKPRGHPEASATSCCILKGTSRMSSASSSLMYCRNLLDWHQW